jgi:hypothetical protein
VAVLRQLEDGFFAFSDDFLFIGGCVFV